MTQSPLSDGRNLDGRIFTIRETRVMLDSDLASLYDVETGALNRAVERNARRFPPDFAFRLRAAEWENLKCQFGISSSWGGRRRSPPRVFTEHGTVMLAAVLNSDRAVEASILVVQAFVRIRHVLSVNAALAKRIDEVAAKLEKKAAADEIAFSPIFQELKRLAFDSEFAEEKPKERIGFRPARDSRHGKAKAARRGKTRK